MEPTFFSSPAGWRAWLKKNHAIQTDLLVGLYKRASGKPSITWPESVDAALCFGWIDAVRHRIDDESYTIRFTRRKLTSIWSAVNIKRVEQLTALGLMHPAGIQAFEARQEKRSRVYSFEQPEIAFTAEQEQQFRANPKAWKFFEAQPPWYRKTLTWWVINAKRPDTRLKRLLILIESAEQSRRLR